MKTERATHNSKKYLNNGHEQAQLLRDEAGHENHVPMTGGMIPSLILLPSVTQAPATAGNKIASIVCH